MRAELRGAGATIFSAVLVSGIVEARRCERFGMIAGAPTDPSLGSFYCEIADSEARHEAFFVALARTYFSRVSVEARFGAVLDAGAKIVEGLVIRPALH